jgi:hypothetical protein
LSFLNNTNHYFLIAIQISLTDPTSNWSFDPKQGLTLKDAKFSDTGYYYCEGQMNFEDRESFTMSVSGMGYAIQILPLVALIGLSI